MNPAQAVLADIELAGIVADDHGVGQEAARLDAAPQRAFGCDHHRIRMDLECRDAEHFEMGVPGLLTHSNARDARSGANPTESGHDFDAQPGDPFRRKSATHLDRSRPPR